MNTAWAFLVGYMWLILGCIALGLFAGGIIRVIEVCTQWVSCLDRDLYLARIAHRRASAILLREEYECFGGPYDGETVRWKQPELSMYAPGGVYNHNPDLRLHFEQLARITFAEDAEC